MLKNANIMLLNLLCLRIMLNNWDILFRIKTFSLISLLQQLTLLFTINLDKTKNNGTRNYRQQL